MPANFDLRCEIPDWKSCVRFNLSSPAPCGRATPCDFIFLGSFGAELGGAVSGAAGGKTGPRGTVAGQSCGIAGVATGLWDTNVWRGIRAQTVVINDKFASFGPAWVVAWTLQLVSQGYFSALVSALLSGLTAGQTGVQGPVLAGLPANPSGESTGKWISNVWRGPGATRTAAHYAGASLHPESGDYWEAPTRLHPEPCARWAQASQAAATVGCPSVFPGRLPADIEQPWTAAIQRLRLVTAPYLHAARRHSRVAGPWTEGAQVSADTRSSFVLAWPRRRSIDVSWEDARRIHRPPLRSPWLIPGRWRHGAPQWWIPWGEGRRPPFVWPPIEPVIPPEPPPFVGDPNLHLRCCLPTWRACIRFEPDRSDCCLRAFPCLDSIRGFIVVINDLSLKLLKNNTPLPCESMTIRGDLDSWAWGLNVGFEGYLPAIIEAADEADREVEATINGYSWRFVLEEDNTAWRIGSINNTMTGRSLSAYLSTPYKSPHSRILDSDRHASQCAGDELVNTGWDIAWTPGIKNEPVVDWLIPAGAWSYEAETALSAIKLLAEASGAVLQTHPSAQRLIVSARYPVSTWALASPSVTPDKQISADVIDNLSRRWVPAPLYNGVYVSGREYGVLAQIKRTGTDGSPCHQMVVDPLISHVDVARERGRNILCAGGKRAMISLTIPLLPTCPAGSGLILPGDIVQVNQSPSWRAYAVGVSISAQHGEVWQTVEIERVYEWPQA